MPENTEGTLRIISLEEMYGMPKGKINVRIIPESELKQRVYPKAAETELENIFRQRGLSPKTAKGYHYYIEKLLQNANKTSVNDITQNDIYAYWASIFERLQNSTKQYILNALKFQFPKFDFYGINAGRQSFKIPDTLSKIEMKQLIDKTKSKKHKFLIKMIYSTGMRLMEIRNLQWKDVDLDDDVIKITGKFSAERYVPIAKSLKDELTILKHNVDDDSQYVFTTSGHQYSDNGIQCAIRRCVNMAGITKCIHVHSLRHIYATHLRDRGVKLEDIQFLLGHKNIKSTLIYAHTSKELIKQIENPLDTL